MSEITFSDIVFYFTVYSFLGWICEVIYSYISEHKFINKGFLTGPFCPIYGFGALFILLFINNFSGSPFYLFVASIVISSVLEYITSYVLEKMFSMRWWDYSCRKFNINGRICLFNSAMFGILGLATVYLVQPLITDFLGNINGSLKQVLSSALVVAFIAQLLYTLNALINLRECINKLSDIYAELENYKQLEKNDFYKGIEHLKENALQLKDGGLIKYVEERLGPFTRVRFSGIRILKSFPKARHDTLDDVLSGLRHYTSKRKFWFKEFIEKMPKVHIIERDNAESFAKGLNFYKLFWIFFISCILGFTIETIFCLVVHGRVESRQGLIYGPISQIYGFGAIIMILILNLLKERKNIWIFIGSVVIGGAFEYTASLIQEKTFGTISWEYSNHIDSIGNGRTNLLYMMFWGMLGILLIRFIYPRLSKFIERIPNKIGIIISWILIVFISFDLVISAFAVYRWVKRDLGVLPKNAIEKMIDTNYPDEFMQGIYPNMMIVRNKN